MLSTCVSSLIFFQNFFLISPVYYSRNFFRVILSSPSLYPSLIPSGLILGLTCATLLATSLWASVFSSVNENINIAFLTRLLEGLNDIVYVALSTVLDTCNSGNFLRMNLYK